MILSQGAGRASKRIHHPRCQGPDSLCDSTKGKEFLGLPRSHYPRVGVEDGRQEVANLGTEIHGLATLHPVRALGCALIS